jgi:hypothetical protein
LSGGTPDFSAWTCARSFRCTTKCSCTNARVDVNTLVLTEDDLLCTATSDGRTRLNLI